MLDPRTQTPRMRATMTLARASADATGGQTQKSPRSDEGGLLKISSLSSQVSALKSQLSSLSSQVSALKSQLSSLSSQVSALKSQLSSLSSQVF